MACRDVTGFDAYVRERLAQSKTEAARVVLEFVAKDRVNMGEAVLLAIEALPTSKTRDLRRIVDLFEPWCEWVEDWSARGWTFKIGYDDVAVVPPKKFDYTSDNARWPSRDVVAAATGATIVKLRHHDGPYGNCPNCDIYERRR